MDKLKPHFWLYETDQDPKCDTCIKFEECGRSGWICGDYKPAEEYQITMEAIK